MLSLEGNDITETHFWGNGAGFVTLAIVFSLFGGLRLSASWYLMVIHYLLDRTGRGGMTLCFNRPVNWTSWKLSSRLSSSPPSPFQRQGLSLLSYFSFTCGLKLPSRVLVPKLPVRVTPVERDLKVVLRTKHGVSFAVWTNVWQFQDHWILNLISMATHGLYPRLYLKQHEQRTEIFYGEPGKVLAGLMLDGTAREGFTSVVWREKVIRCDSFKAQHHLFFNLW